MEPSTEETRELLRPVRARDAANLAPLLDSLGYSADAQQIARRLDRLLDDPAYAACVSVRDGAILGLAAGHLIFPIENDAPAAQLIALVTGDHVRGQGVGTALARAFEEWARAQGAARVIVNSGSQRLHAHSFYAGLGYATTGVRLGKQLDPLHQ